jgi:hypothetical protein
MHCAYVQQTVAELKTISGGSGIVGGREEALLKVLRNLL